MLNADAVVGALPNALVPKVGFCPKEEEPNALGPVGAPKGLTLGPVGMELKAPVLAPPPNAEGVLVFGSIPV